MLARPNGGSRASSSIVHRMRRTLTAISGGRKTVARRYRATAICALLISAVPVVAVAQANINTSRSNTKGSAAPSGDGVSAEGSGGDQAAGRKGYEYYQAQSDHTGSVTEPEDTGQPVEKANHNTARSNKNTVAAPADPPDPAQDAAGASTTVPKQTQGATFGERVNAGLNAPGKAASQGTEPQAQTDACAHAAQGKQRAVTKSGQRKAAGNIDSDKGKPDSCDSLIR